MSSDEQEKEYEDQAAEEEVRKIVEKQTRIKRILAFIALFILAALVIWLIICIITGSKYTLAVLFCLILYPVLLYVFLWLKKVFA